MVRHFLRGLSLVLALLPMSALAHPGSGIVVDDKGHIYFVDTGAGVWKLDRLGRLEKQPGEAFHWMAIDRRGALTARDMPRGEGGDFPVVGPDPTLILSSDSPVAVGPDGAFYYPHARGDRVELMRLPPGGRPNRFAELPPVLEVGRDGKERAVPWIHGLAAGPDGSLYYAERDAVRKVSPDGSVRLVAGGIAVPGCTRPQGIDDDRLGPALRGLDVAPDGTIYVAASACRAVLKIAPDGAVTVALRAEDNWSPTAVACSGDELYVLEYWTIKTDRREDWIPRVRKVTSEGNASVLATVKR